MILVPSGQFSFCRPYAKHLVPSGGRALLFRYICATPHPREVRIAIDYATAHRDDVQSRIDRNRRIAEQSERLAKDREALLN